MINEKETVKYCIDSLMKAGVQKAQCRLENKEKNELNVESDKISLFRTTFDTNLHLTGIINDKKGSLMINKMDKESIDKAVVEVVELAQSSEVDSANDISEKQPAKVFNSGSKESNLDLMYDRIKEFLKYEKETYPKTILEQVILDFTKSKRCFQNSNGVDFITNKGIYNFVVMFTSKEGKKSSSYNYSEFSSKTLDKKLKDFGSIDTLLRQSTEQITTKPFTEKIIGDVIITPDCLGDFIRYITGFLYDYSLITGTSIYKDKLNESIADKKFTLYSRPISDEISDNYFFTNDGYEAQDSTIIDKGILKTFLLSLYGSNKTGKPKAVNSGGKYIIEPGDKSLEDMIKSIRRGILLCRFSCGNPSDNGDFSGVAKNSYYIVDGEIKHPLSETMIAGNLGKMLYKIKNISKERINFGASIFPWIQFSDLTISGK